MPSALPYAVSGLPTHHLSPPPAEGGMKKADRSQPSSSSSSSGTSGSRRTSGPACRLNDNLVERARSNSSFRKGVSGPVVRVPVESDVAGSK